MAFAAGSISNHCKPMEKEGAAEGASNRPDSASTAPDLNEVRSITTAKQGIVGEESTFTDALVSADRQSSEISQRVDALEASCSSHLGHDLVESAFHSSLAKHEHDLVSTCATEMEKRAELNGFKSRNEIKDAAKYPDDSLFHFSLLILFVALETGVNAIFYEGSSGLLGGAMIALAVSLVNMGFAGLMGALFRYSNLPEMKNKVLGYGALLGFVLTGFVLNLIFSTFRIQYQIVQLRVVEEGLPEATTTMLVGALKSAVVDAFGVFQLNFPAIDFYSFTLFFVGFGCSALAFWKGYTFDDKYPGYGDIDRAHKASEKAFKQAKNSAFEDAMAGVHRMAAEVEQLRDQIVTEQRNASALKAQVQGAHASFYASVKSIQGELNLVLETYRAANRATRTTTPPAHFAELPNIAPVDDGVSRCDTLITRIESTALKAKSLADNRATVLGQRLTQIRQTINTLVAQEFHKWIETVRKSAETTIGSRGQSGA